MKIQLIDRNTELCDRWHLLFKDRSDVVVYNGDIFSLKTDCIISPANSFGFMDGGIDQVISDKLLGVQEKLQRQIKEKYHGELLVGQAELIETENEEIPFCISAPTMRVPSSLGATSVNVYLALRTTEE